MLANKRQPFVQAFPQSIHRDVLILLQNRTVEFWRYCGGEIHSVLGIDEWMILKTIISDVEVATKRIARACADNAFEKQTIEPSLCNDGEREAFLQKLHEESDLPSELLLRLWNDERVKIKSLGTASYEERLAELKAENMNQLENMWKTRVYVPSQIYAIGLESLEASSLKDQLHELLHIHLSQDLVPSTLKRLRTRELLREQAAVKQVDKLEAAITSQKKGTPIMKSIDKFHEKMGFSPLTPEELGHATNQHLGRMVKSMADDDDAPRLFLTTVLVVLAQRNGNGIVYATGKFAPRLLKSLKTELAEDQYANLERLKEAVKAGRITDDDREEMRSIATGALGDQKLTAREEDPTPPTEQ